MNKAELIYCDFTMNRLEQAAKMTADSFEVNNEFTKQGREKRQEVEARTVMFLTKMDLAMKKYNQRNGTNLGFIKMLLYRNQMVALVGAIDVHYFLQFMVPIIGPEEPLLKAFRLFQLQKFPKNSTLTAFLLTVHKDYMNGQVSKLLIQNCINDIVSAGFKRIIGGSTNPISRDIALKLGGKLFKDVIVNRNGKDGHFYLMSIQVADILKIKAKL